MSDSPTRLYEGLFMVSQAAAGSDFAGVVAHIKEVLARAEAEVHILTKWDERRLAYDIKTAKRGTYFLAAFNARSTQVANIERDCNLSEIIVRALILRGDHIGETELEELMKLTPAEQETALRPSEDEAPQAEEEVAEKTEEAAPEAAEETKVEAEPVEAAATEAAADGEAEEEK